MPIFRPQTLESLIIGVRKERHDLERRYLFKGHQKRNCWICPIIFEHIDGQNRFAANLYCIICAILPAWILYLFLCSNPVVNGWSSALNTEYLKKSNNIRTWEIRQMRMRNSGIASRSTNSNWIRSMLQLRRSFSGIDHVENVTPHSSILIWTPPHSSRTLTPPTAK